MTDIDFSNIQYTDKYIPVDTGRLLLVDPAYLPKELLDHLLNNDLAAMFTTPYGDGEMYAYSMDHELTVIPSLAMECLIADEEVPEGRWEDGDE